MAIALAPGDARAGSCTDNAAYNGSAYTYTICGVPDLDQRRLAVANDPALGTVAGLPNEGKMYCAPTSALDWMIYIANRGYPAIAPGPGRYGFGDWPDEYNAASVAIQTMGLLMGTSATDGTEANPAVNAMRAWLGSPGNVGPFAVSYYGESAGKVPRSKDLALAAIDGALVMAQIGWYKTFDELASDDQKAVADALGLDFGGLFRAGGHVVAMTGAAGTGSGPGDNKLIKINDPARPKPANDLDKVTQSPFSTETWPLETVFGEFDGDTRYQDRLVGYGKGYLDGYFAIRPKYGLSALPSGGISIMKPIHFGAGPGGDRGGSSVYSPPDGARATEVAVAPEGTRSPYLVAGDNTIRMLDTLTRTSERFATVPHATRLVYGGRDQSLYVLAKNELVRLDRDGRRTSTRPLRRPVDAIAYDTASDRLLAVSAADGRVLAFDHDLEPAGDQPLRLDPCARGAALRAVVAGDGALWLHCDGDASALRVPSGRDAAPRRVPLGVPGQGFDVDDDGGIVTSVDGRLVVLSAAGVPDERSPFAGLPAGPDVDLLHGFSSAGPLESTALFRNVLPEDAQ